MGVAKWLLAVGLAASLGGPAPAAFLPTLFGTGLKAGGTPADDGDNELHYTVLSGPVTGTPLVFTEAGTQAPLPPRGTWINDDSSMTSRWIAPTPTTRAPGGEYTYRTTFDLTGFTPGTASLTGKWAADDTGLDILLNGISLSPASPSYGAFVAFGTTNGSLFRAGTNTLDFVLRNDFTQGEEFGPTGLRVEVSGDASSGGVATPVPPTALLAVFALAVAGVARRKRG